MAKMIGYSTRKCPYGRSCTCNEAPGKATKVARRNAKRSERQRTRSEIDDLRMSRAHWLTQM